MKGRARRVAIVGAGPAGLLAAHELAKGGLAVTVIEEGSDVKDRRCPMMKLGYCIKCRPCHFMHGVGGGGAFSDGKLNLSPEIGGNLLEFVPEAEALRLIEKVDSFFVKYGGKGGETPVTRKAEELKRRAKTEGVKFIPIRQRHMGSDRLPAIINKMVADMRKMGVQFLIRTKADNLIIEGGAIKGVFARDLRTKDVRKIPADFVIVASGRGGAKWFSEICRKNRIATRFQPLDVGVRVEVPAEIMSEVTSINWDPKFHIRTKRYDDFVRTFCTNPGGFVITESYDGEYICVNGHSMRGKKSVNTNFALLVQVALTEPVENTTKYGEGIARLATIIGGGKPTLQRLGDLKAGRRSTWERIDRSYVSPTLREVTPGDISMCLPARIVIDLLEGLEVLNKVIPGVAEDETLLYAPEIKFHALRVNVAKNMETTVKNLFAAGDGAGVSRGIVGACATGLIAAGEIIKRCKNA